MTRGDAKQSNLKWFPTSDPNLVKIELSSSPDIVITSYGKYDDIEKPSPLETYVTFAIIVDATGKISE